MYDLKANYAFMPHKRDANKTTVGSFGLECLACTGRELQCFPRRFRLTLDNSRQSGKTVVNKTEGNERPVKQENKVNSECNS